MGEMPIKQLDIIRAACTVFEKHGYSGTGMETIAEAAKVSKRTLYKYYGSKEIIFSEIINHLRQSATLKQCPHYQRGRSLRKQLVRVVYAMLAHVNREEHIRLARIIIAEVVREPKLSEILSEAAVFSKSAPFLWIRAAIEDGQLRPVAPEKALTHLSGLVKSAVMWPRLFFCHDPLTEEEIRNYAEEYTDFFLSYYRA